MHLPGTGFRTTGHVPPDNEKWSMPGWMSIFIATGANICQEERIAECQE
jgi:hypothetical protein